MRAISNDFRAMSDVPGRFGTPRGNAALKCGVDFAELSHMLGTGSLLVVSVAGVFAVAIFEV
jgi:hypothetical protein